MLVRNVICLLAHPHLPSCALPGWDNDHLEYFVEYGVRLWLASDGRTGDRRTNVGMIVHATGVVLNTFTVSGHKLPGMAADILNAADVFTSTFDDRSRYWVVALNIDVLPWRIALPCARRCRQAFYRLPAVGCKSWC